MVVLCRETASDVFSISFLKTVMPFSKDGAYLNGWYLAGRRACMAKASVFRRAVSPSAKVWNAWLGMLLSVELE